LLATQNPRKTENEQTFSHFQDWWGGYWGLRVNKAPKIPFFCAKLGQLEKIAQYQFFVFFQQNGSQEEFKAIKQVFSSTLSQEPLKK